LAVTSFFLGFAGLSLAVTKKLAVAASKAGGSLPQNKRTEIYFE
jgi:hypothetical protein